MAIYKRDQGTYVRGALAVSLGILLIFAVYQLHDWLNFTEASGSWLAFMTRPLGQLPGTGMELTARLIVSVSVFLAGAYGIWALHNWAYFADYMIETEGELRRVNWPTRKEVSNSSMVVVITVVILGIYMLCVDTVLTYVSRTLWRNL